MPKAPAESGPSRGAGVTIRVPAALRERLRTSVRRLRRHGSKALPDVARPIVEDGGVSLATLVDVGQLLLERALADYEKRQRGTQ